MDFAASVKSALATARAVAGVSIVYQRGSASVAITATPGKTEFDVDSQNGIVERVISRDYLIAPDDLIIDGDQVEPARGDRIVENDGTTTRTTEVLMLGDKPGWRWTDQFRTEMRIHTKLIKQVAS